MVLLCNVEHKRAGEIEKDYTCIIHCYHCIYSRQNINLLWMYAYFEYYSTTLINSSSVYELLLNGHWLSIGTCLICSFHCFTEVEVKIHYIKFSEATTCTRKTIFFLENTVNRMDTGQEFKSATCRQLHCYIKKTGFSRQKMITSIKLLPNLYKKNFSHGTGSVQINSQWILFPKNQRQKTFSKSSSKQTSQQYRIRNSFIKNAPLE